MQWLKLQTTSRDAYDLSIWKLGKHTKGLSRKTINETSYLGNRHIDNIGIFGSCRSAVLRFFNTATYAAAATTNAATNVAATDRAASDAGADGSTKGFAA